MSYEKRGSWLPYSYPPLSPFYNTNVSSNEISIAELSPFPLGATTNVIRKAFPPCTIDHSRAKSIFESSCNNFNKKLNWPSAWSILTILLNLICWKICKADFCSEKEKKNELRNIKMQDTTWENEIISKLEKPNLVRTVVANGWFSLVEGPFKKCLRVVFFRQTNEGKILLAPGATNMEFAYKSGTSIRAPAMPAAIRVIQKWREREREQTGIEERGAKSVSAASEPPISSPTEILTSRYY